MICLIGHFGQKREIALTQEIPVLYRDEHIIVVHKPAGFLVHPYKSRSAARETLMSLTRDQIGQYVYPVHRLDRPVSGAVVFGLTGEAVKLIKDRWHTPETKKHYLALCIGTPPSEGKFTFPLKDKWKRPQSAHTEYFPYYDFDGEYTLVKVQIFTGRKHQIRRHFSRRMHNLVGDTAHGNGKVNNYFREKYGLQRIFLHAYQLEFIHPYENKKVSVIAKIPDDLKSVLVKMGVPAQDVEEMI